LRRIGRTEGSAPARRLRNVQEPSEQAAPADSIGADTTSVSQVAETPVESRVEVAGQWQLMWWKFRKHKLAMAGGIVTILVYLVAIFAEFLAPYPGGRPQCATHLRAPATLATLRAHR
jgi:multidrug efflux pump subunit AcrB